MDKKRQRKRKLIQLFAALLYNADIKNFSAGTIYRGKTKGVCVPGLNCYSCPGAIAACPLGALQSALAAKQKGMLYYIVGILLLFGIGFGRMICGFLCPMGLLFELLYKIPTKKVPKSKATRILCCGKYLVLIAVAIGLTCILVSPSFCKWLCPAGFLEAGVPLAFTNRLIREQVGALFILKGVITTAIVLGSIFVFRLFCRFLCPLGAVYSLFNRFSLWGIKVDTNACVHCGKCSSVCKTDARIAGDRECISCGLCVEQCPTHAVSYKGILKKERRK